MILFDLSEKIRTFFLHNFIIQRDEKDKSEKLPNDEDKGIEMEEDFEGDTFSVSVDSGDDEKEEEEEDVNIESKMGETGNDKEVVDEKLWDKNKDEEPEKSDAEKYESGPSVQETETGDEELRAKEDDAPSHESGEAENDEDGNEDYKNIPEEDNELDDMKLDKKNAFEEPTGIELSDHEKDLKNSKKSWRKLKKNSKKSTVTMLMKK